MCLSERSLLQTERGPLAERTPVRLLADERDPRRLQLAGDLLESFRGSLEVAAPEIVGTRRRPVGGVRDPDRFVENRVLLARVVEPRGEARFL